jgi:NhaP-type Na+/H+ or K+/H+ antiporter
MENELKKKLYEDLVETRKEVLKSNKMFYTILIGFLFLISIVYGGLGVYQVTHQLKPANNAEEFFTAIQSIIMLLFFGVIAAVTAVFGGIAYIANEIKMTRRVDDLEKLYSDVVKGAD